MKNPSPFPAIILVTLTAINGSFVYIACSDGSIGRLVCGLIGCVGAVMAHWVRECEIARQLESRQ